MSIHEQHADGAANGEFIARALRGLPSAFDLLPAGSETGFIAVNTNRSWANGPGKRGLDLMVAIPVLLALAPVLALIALLVRLDSPGPALFRQRRNGLCGRTFQILKFRTMHVLEDGDTIRQATPGDARTTRIGRVLRATSLDELPQLINVIRGEMSLVGPRPHARAHDALYGELVADYRHRQAVKPGITGWAQINGLRGPTPTVESMSRRIGFDLWYARHASLAVDLQILVRTPFEVLRRRNAC